MYSIANLKVEDRKALFDAYSFQYRESPAIIEKDFWVTLLLDYLFNHSEFREYFTFKGGTSLSKCFNIINRFSEDIDLILDWSALGYSDEEIYEERSNSAQLKYNKSVEDAAMEFIENKLKPSMEEGLQKLLNFKPNFTLGEDKHVLNFNYPNIYNANNSGILQCVRLEIGPLAERVPSIERTIEPLVSKMTLPIMSQTSTKVRCISPERTFWEKILILHQEAHRPLTKKDKDGAEIPNPTPRRYSRHYYDVWKISQTEYKNNALNDINLLKKVITFKKKFYRYSWDHLEAALPGAIVLIPNEARFNDLRKDFESMKAMINDDEIKSFDELLEHLKKLEDEINKPTI